MNKIYLTLVTALATLLAVSTSVIASESSTIEAQTMVLDVHKSPTCGCCSGWVKHMEESGFKTHANHPQNLTDLKNQMGVPANARSCHTAISQQGYIFEGHIPAKFIEKFLMNPPKNAKGLIVPAMPVGSPGMEYNHQFMPYSVLLLNEDGTLSPYAKINSPQDQL